MPLCATNLDVVEGQAGVTGVLEQLGEELERAMALCSTPTIADVDSDLVD